MLTTFADIAGSTSVGFEADKDKDLEVLPILACCDCSSTKSYQSKMAGEGEKISVHSKAGEGMVVAPVENETANPIVKVDSFRDDHHVNLTWRSWVVVL